MCPLWIQDKVFIRWKVRTPEYLFNTELPGYQSLPPAAICGILLMLSFSITSQALSMKVVMKYKYIQILKVRITSKMRERKFWTFVYFLDSVFV